MHHLQKVNGWLIEVFKDKDIEEGFIGEMAMVFVQELDEYALDFEEVRMMNIKVGVWVNNEERDHYQFGVVVGGKYSFGYDSLHGQCSEGLWLLNI